MPAEVKDAGRDAGATAEARACFTLTSPQQRVITGLALGGIALAALLGLPTPAWGGVMLVIVALGAWEWAGLVKFEAPARLAYALATPLATLGLYYFVPREMIAAVAAVFWLLLAPLWLARGWPIPGGLGAALLGWLLLAPTGYAAVYLHGTSPMLLLACILLAVIADSAAYFSGRRFGKHKLAPQISPGKSWEGVIGAGLAVALYALLVDLFVLREAIGKSALLLGYALALFVASILGDLFESHAKRQAGIKDSGNWLPGHGGVMDRIDSLTAVLPLALCLLILWP
ncbi:MAG: phosphatidate cytidylyltransferase [Pseudomonadota bacterium]|nr:phosphatidate cytidylyltransferase [Pseudomonadota bacterium]